MESKTENCRKPALVEWHETPIVDPARKMCDAELVYWAMVQWEIERDAHEELAEADAEYQGGCVVD